MNIDSHQNIFPFLLDLFGRLDNKDFNYSNKSIISYDFKGFFFNYEHNFNYVELKNFLMRNNFAKELMNENHLFMAELLKVICQNIYYFDEYEDIYKTNNDSLLKSNKYTLMLLPEGSISIEIDKRIAGTKHRYGLRKRRDYDQKDLCHRLNLQNVYFYKNKDEFEINQHFLISNGLKRNLMDRTLSVAYCPYMKLELERNDLFEIKSTNKTFEVSYFKGSDKKYLKYLSMSLKAKSDFYIFPELAISNADIDNVTKTIKECNLKHECIIVAGSDLKKKRNTCYVFNQKGKLLLKQDKYIPYEIKDSEEDLICLEKQEINLLNIRNVGLFAFPICADMLSEKYIGNVFCQCKVTNLIISCFSKSNDIYDSLSHLSSNYWMVNFACNSPIGKNKVVGYQSTPYKKPHSSKRSYREKYISLSKIKHPRFNKTIKPITRKVKI